uniref:NADH-ubiquinone oxidoreductase chain 3 n=1 Tax=Aphelocheirus ellipsoideus TaxID=575831 RepID=C5HIG5_9HEMI|nr:NADH dehydrogenase subunit 3 [Aphelocheirus ellipsoideus]
MISITMTMIFMFMISMMLIIIYSVISKAMMNDREKMSPFECGFDPKSSSRIPFSIQFFLIAVLFLIFDIEIVIILPAIITMTTSMIKMWFTVITLFVAILLFGLFHEWKNGILEWAN